LDPFLWRPRVRTEAMMEITSGHDPVSRSLELPPRDTAPLHICHVTTVHPWNDVRVFQRMCAPLAHAGFRVTLVAPVHEETTVEGVHLVPTHLCGKLARLRGGASILRKLRAIRADLYHFHDPELLPWMFLYQKSTPSAAVIYDVHEYCPETLVHFNFFGWPILNQMMSHIVLHT